MVQNLHANESYVLYQCGTTAPVLAGYKAFAIPLQTLAVEDTSVLGFLELLGLQLSVRYLQPQYVTSACLLALANNGEMQTLEASWGSNPTLRQTQLAAVGALFTSAASSTANSIAISSTADATPLTRAEWIKFVAVFFNQEQAADALFATITRRYLCQRQAAVAVTPQPVVAWTSYSWWASPPQWVLARASYKQTFVQDAGAQGVGNGTADQLFNSAADLLAHLADADQAPTASYVRP